MKISRSYARKLNHEFYGGRKYESSDFFANYEQEIAPDATEDQIKVVSDFLFSLAKNDVSLAIDKEIKNLKESPPF